MEIQRARNNSERSVTLSVSGTVNTSNYTMLEEALNSELLGSSDASGGAEKSGDAALIILDLSGARYITSLGMRTLVSAQKKANRLHKKLVISGAGPEILETFETTGFISLFTVI